MATKTPQPFPSPAAVHDGEADILARVIANLADHDAKLVYADWLEDRDDARGPLLRDFVQAYRAKRPLPDVSAAPEPWRDLVGLTLVADAVAVNPAFDLDLLLAHARPALTFKSEAAKDEDFPRGASKFGGSPDLPTGTAWPRFDGTALSFLAQFDLGALARSPVCRELPAGLLSVFFDTRADGWDGGLVVHTPPGAELRRLQPPDELATGAYGEDRRYKPAALAFTEALTLPHGGSPWYEHGGPFVNTQGMSDLAAERPGLGHSLLGYAHALQNDVHQKLSVRHLLTIDSDDAPGWMWGDTGLLYFMIDEDDLRNGRFDRVTVEMQCC
jgi:uncharacterized protein (TIGR02996 family)